VNLGELRAQLRNRLDDLSGKRLWSDAELNAYINEAYFEAAERSLILQDAITLPLIASQASYIVTGALRIEAVHVTGQARPLAKRAAFDLDREYPSWRVRDPGTPESFIPVDDRLTVWPTPATAGSARVEFRRMPLALLEGDADEPEIPARYHLRMLDWALHLSYDKRDADGSDSARANMYAARFTEAFGERLTAKQQQGRSDGRRHVTRSSW
jgi:hypothetical protein